MPLYEYKCKKCEKEFQSITTVKKREHSKCPYCGGSGKKLPSTGVAFHDIEGRFNN